MEFKLVLYYDVKLYFTLFGPDNGRGHLSPDLLPSTLLLPKPNPGVGAAVVGAGAALQGTMFFFFCENRHHWWVKIQSPHRQLPIASSKFDSESRFESTVVLE
jgi:hypothetical protein